MQGKQYVDKGTILKRRKSEWYSKPLQSPLRQIRCAGKLSLQSQLNFWRKETDAISLPDKTRTNKTENILKRIGEYAWEFEKVIREIILKQIWNNEIER